MKPREYGRRNLGAGPNYPSGNQTLTSGQPFAGSLDKGAGRKARLVESSLLLLDDKVAKQSFAGKLRSQAGAWEREENLELGNEGEGISLV